MNQMLLPRARLRSAYVGAAYSHEQGGERHYRPVVEFIYEVSEYLKGDGSGEIAVAASFFGNPTSVSQQSALDLALSTAERMTNHMIKGIENDLDCDEPSVEGIRRSGRCLQRWEIGDNILYGEEWLVFLTQERPYPSLYRQLAGRDAASMPSLEKGDMGHCTRPHGCHRSHPSVRTTLFQTRGILQPVRIQSTHLNPYLHYPMCENR